MVKKVQESKDKKAAKALSSSSKEKKKWAQGKAKEGIRRAITIDAEVFARIEKEVAKASAVVPGGIAEKYNLNVGVCIKVLNHLVECGVLVVKYSSSKLRLYGKPEVKAHIETVVVENEVVAVEEIKAGGEDDWN